MLIPRVAIICDGFLGAVVAVVLVFTTAIPGDSTNGGSPVGVANANNYADTEVFSQYLQLPVHSVGNKIYVPGC